MTYLQKSMNNNNLREKRKLDHIKLALELPTGPVENGFSDIHLIHNALPEVNYADVDLTCTWLGKRLKAPLIINAITGGAQETQSINGALARTAGKLGIAMAVGSQTSALNNNELKKTYSIARQENPAGLLLANVGALVSWEKALSAVEMIEADGLQIHLNSLQELLMPEGDRSFKGILHNIAEIIARCPVPVIVKEVGFGISMDVGRSLFEVGVKEIDISGLGGTNFAAIEIARSKQKFTEDFITWGIPTAKSILEIANLNLPLQIIASGGIVNGIEIAKALRIGATMVGIAGRALKFLLEKNEADLYSYIEDIITELKMTLLLTGSENIKCFRDVPIVVTGDTVEWIKQRKLNLRHLNINV
ncbi:type 2 isopentenyl-diphosphate Delta-isomerase [Bacillota bacterium LX-D]|nr:type 2 isopentenyl-diphosphate Delta-isomerase [Bacillota bacterium LX-D]